MLIHFFIIPNLMAKHHARRDGAAWLIPVLAHPAHKNGHMVARQPHVLAHRALRIDSFRAEADGVLGGRAQ